MTFAATTDVLWVQLCDIPSVAVFREVVVLAPSTPRALLFTDVVCQAYYDVRMSLPIDWRYGPGRAIFGVTDPFRIHFPAIFRFLVNAVKCVLPPISLQRRKLELFILE